MVPDDRRAAEKPGVVSSILTLGTKRHVEVIAEFSGAQDHDGA
ncbi:MAG TPA: hypothetical protein VKI19_14630 [Acidimicrobiales bacterium]|jgi:hypothetical protein|nr:hypothetical protein [Acidimicrobiales bacterium]